MMRRPLQQIASGFRHAMQALRTFTDHPAPITAQALPPPMLLPTPVRIAADVTVPPPPACTWPTFAANRDFYVRVVRDPQYASGGIDDTSTDAFDGIDAAYEDDGCQTDDYPEAGYDDPMAYVVPVMSRRVRYIGSRIRPNRFMLAG